MILKAKQVSYGLIEVREQLSFMGFGFRYGLYINDQLKQQSNDLTYLIREFDRL